MPRGDGHRGYPYKSVFRNRDHDKHLMVRGDWLPPTRRITQDLDVHEGIADLVTAVVRRGWLVKGASEGAVHSYIANSTSDNTDFEASISFIDIQDAALFADTVAALPLPVDPETGVPRYTRLDIHVHRALNDLTGTHGATVGFDPAMIGAMTELLGRTHD